MFLVPAPPPPLQGAKNFRARTHFATHFTFLSKPHNRVMGSQQMVALVVSIFQNQQYYETMGIHHCTFGRGGAPTKQFFWGGAL